ncbi:uncharacterized protein QC764_704750 [Podospora pseudoanserina]|uniref:Mid2 domain-containing protein n=1 Tax=Podospora pseudoanserina TaxID=2609844 RepID=A0ABR0HI72_9PEZI|nr:hypothetical protein QC764_704750 [Podospora pseudoanserina]
MSIEYQLARIMSLAMLSGPFAIVMLSPASGRGADRHPSLISAYIALVLPALLLFVTYPATVDAQITCYGFAGQAYTDNTLCPGSNACCGRKATCLSNRLCHNPNDPEGLWVRGPCAIREWDDSCGQICLYNETAASNGVLPRVVQCRDGSLCCNNDPQCCQDGKGTFLDEGGEIVSTRATGATTSFPPLSETGTVRTTAPVPTTSTSSSSTFSSTFSESTSSSSTTEIVVPPTNAGPATPAPTPSDEDNNGLKIGLGVGIPCAVLVAALLAFLFFRRQKKKASNGPVAELHGASRDMVEVHGHDAHAGGYYRSEFQSKMPPLYSGARPVGGTQQKHPVEMGGEMATELDGGPMPGNVVHMRRAEMG